MFKFNSEFPFVHGQPLVMACHFTGVYDVNRSTVLRENDYSLIEVWASSLSNCSVNSIVFHNNFSEETCKFHKNKHLHFERVELDKHFTPNVFRYIVYREYLRLHALKVHSLFVTDITDVVMVNNPFAYNLFITHPQHLFCGDEPKTLENEWMNDHSTHLRSCIADYAEYEKRFKEAELLNCGIIGGSCIIMQNFIRQLAAIHENYNANNTTLYTGDMGAFNYLVRTRFNDHLLCGAPINTIFKKYETQRMDCWFRHK